MGGAKQCLIQSESYEVGWTVPAVNFILESPQKNLTGSFHLFFGGLKFIHGTRANDEMNSLAIDTVMFANKTFNLLQRAFQLYLLIGLALF